MKQDEVEAGMAADVSSLRHPPDAGIVEALAEGRLDHDGLERFFELSEDLLCIAGFDGYFRHLSSSWSALLGFTVAELTAVEFDSFVHPDDRERTARQFAEQVASGVKGIRFDNRYRHKDGSYRSLSWNAIPDADRGLVYAMARWIDPQLDAQRALRESEERFRSAFEDALVGMCLASPSGEFLQVNSTFATMLGRPRDELVGMHFSDVTHPDDVDRNLASVRAVVAGEATGFHDEKRYLRADGVEIIASLATTLVRDAHGEPSHFVTQLLDVTQERAAAAELAASAATLDAIVQNSQSLVYVKDLNGVYLLANRPFLEAFSVSERDLIGRDDLWLDADLEPVWRVNDLRARDGAYRLEEWSGHGASRHWYESVKFPLYDGAGVLYATCGVSLEVTELHRQREEADRAAAFSAAVLAASPDAIVVDELISGRSVYASRMAAEIVGETAGVTDVALASAGAQPEDQHRLAEALAAVGDLSDGQVLQVRYRSRDAESGHRWLSRRITPFRRDEDGRPVEILSVVRDVSDVVAAEETLTHAALHDPLTGLPNRTLLSDRLTGALFRARRHQQEVAVLFCDLDGFKRVNDSTGHAAGDAVLVETARRLRDCLRSLDTVARVGGDEFVVIVEPLDHGDTVPMPTARQLGESVARRIVATVGKPVVVGETSQSITVSVGLAFAGGAGDAEMTAEDVLRDADAAMYRAKSRGGDRFEVCDPGLQSDLTERGRVASLLRHAIASSSDGVDSPGMSTAPPRGRATCAGALDVAYQPIYDADTGRLAGFEALARLSDSGGTPVPPDVFINVAEEIGLIRPLGMQVLKQACGALARWRSTLPDADHLTMAINLSARQAHHPDLVDEVLAALAEEHLPPDKIVLELTESVLIQAGPSTVKTFQTLHDAGVGIHIDDFGTGYSSLRYLVEFPVTAVKIDRSFTAGLPDDPTSLSIVRAVAGLARDLNLGCTVEGIETVEQQSSLPDGVLLQGYLLGRPGPASSAEQTILAHQTAK